jgi:mono/diheme cytochrome c family protein
MLRENVKKFIIGSVLAVVLVTATLACYPGLGFMSVAADQTPSTVEVAFMTASMRKAVQRQAPSIPSPIPDSLDSLIAGGRLYLNDCVGCHGDPSKAPSRFGATFYPPAPQFGSVGTPLSAAQIFWAARNGIRMTGMYPQESYSDLQLWRLAAFIGRARALPPDVVKALHPSA